MLFRADTREMTELAKAFEVAAANVAMNRPVVLRALAVQNLTWAMRDFRDKSRGQRGGDGVQWSPIEAETVRNRLRKLKAYRTRSESVKAARAKVKQRTTEARKAKAKIGQVRGDVKAMRKAVRSFKAATKRLASAKTRLAKAKDSRTQYVAKVGAGAKIGIDTGRLVNSLVSGVRGITSVEPFTPKPGNSDAVPPALVEFDAFGFTVGTVVKYAKWFDEERPIFGIGFHSPQRVTAMSQLAARAHQMAALRAASRQNPKPATETELKDDSTE